MPLKQHNFLNEKYLHVQSFREGRILIENVTELVFVK